MTLIVGQIYQHRYGGLYIVNGIAVHTETKVKLVVCTHLYPFEKQILARPIEEWTENRFKIITNKEYLMFTKKDRLKFQIEIGKARAEKGKY